MLQRLHCLTVQHLRALFAHRAAGKACLTEAAAPDTAPEGLQIGPVVDNFGRRHNHFRRKIGAVQILDDTFGHRLRRAVQRSDGFQGTVFVILVAVKAGNVHTGYFGDLFEESVLVPVLRLGPVIQGHNLHGAVLPFPQRKEIDKLRQRLRVKGAHAAGKDDVLKPNTVLCMERNTG